MATVKKNDNKVVSYPGDPEVNAAAAEQLGLSAQDYTRLERELGRKPSFSELNIAATLWSERCGYRSSRAQIRRLPASGTHVVHGPGENAGVLDIGDGNVVVLRLENRSLDEAAQSAAAAAAAAVLGDVLAMGGKPVALLDGLRITRPENGKSSKVLREAVAGLSDLARQADLPVVGGFAEVEPGRAPELSLLAVGTARRDQVFRGTAAGLGSKVIHVGAKTFDALAPERTKQLSEALQRALQSGLLEGCEDIDAGGLCAAALEMAARAGTGIELDLDLVPTSDENASPASLLISESPQRFLLVAKRGREEAVLSILAEHRVEAATIGVVTNTQRFVCKATPHGDASAKQTVIADLAVASMTTDAPRNERAPKANEQVAGTADLPNERDLDLERELVRLMGSASGGGREWIYKQLGARKDSALLGPGQADSAVMAVATGESEAPKHLAFALDSNSRQLDSDPRQGAMALVAECARNIVCSGGEPLGLLDAITLREPESAHAAHVLSECVEGLREASIALKVPVIAGHVRTSDGDAGVALSIGMVGQLRGPEDKLSIGFRRQADMVALLGVAGSKSLAGSLWLGSRTRGLGQAPLPIDLGAEVKLQRAVLELAREQLLSSAHDVSEGGLGVCIAECCVAGKIGCSIELPSVEGASALACLFNELPSRVVVSFPPENREKVQQRATALGVPFTLLGFVGGDTMEVEDQFDVPVQVLEDCHARALDDLTAR